MEKLAVSEERSVMESYLTLARYADNQYRRIERHMESSAFEAKRQLLQKSKASSEWVLNGMDCYTLSTQLTRMTDYSGAIMNNYILQWSHNGSTAKI